MKIPPPLHRILSILLAATLFSGLTLHAAPVQPAQASGFSLFEPAVQHPVGEIPYAVAVGDLNMDGKPDLVTANDHSASVLLNIGDGTFSQATDFNLGEAVAVSVIIQDVDTDGMPDIIFAGSVDHTIWVLMNDGNGAFVLEHAPYAVGMHPFSVAVGDFNRDGKPDLVAANGGNDDVSILLNDGSGVFLAPTRYSTDSGPSSVTVADFNRDEKLDLVTANGGGNTVSVLMGNGDGTFRARVDYSTGEGTFFVRAGDLDLNGNLDLAVANSSDDDVSVHFGNGDGTFQEGIHYAVGNVPQSVAIDDFNHDGYQDLITANANDFDNSISLLLNQGDGTFQSAGSYPSGGQATYMAEAGDVNADGRPDIIAANTLSDSVSVLINANLDDGSVGLVRQVTPTGTGDCSSWANACGLQTALAAAVPGSEIWVAAGMYKPTDGLDRLTSFHLKDGVAIYGGFAGTETERSQRDWGANVTILSGEIGDPEVKEDNSCHIVSSTNVGSTTVLDGFHIEGSYCLGNDYLTERGGGMRNYQNASPTLRNLTIANNSATFGGGMYNGQNSSPTLENVHFLNNEGGYGGGMANEDSSNPTVIDSLFQGNTALIHGGGIYNEANSNLLLVRVTFNSNIGDGWGGGIRNVRGLITLIDVVFEKNVAYSIGGAIDNCGSMVLQNATFEKNTGGYRGGAISNRCEASAVVANAVFLDNDAREEGGAIYNNLESQINITNATFYGNRAGLGGSISGNVGSPISVRNSIVWNDLGAQPYTTFDHSIVQGIANDPVNGVYGDEAHTPVFISPANSDFRLAENSPGVDAGLNTWLPIDSLDLDKDGNKAELLPFDRISMKRVSGEAVDLGAYETGYATNMAVNDIVPAFDEDSTSQFMDVLANDRVPDGGHLTITSVVQGSKGMVSIEADGLRYDPFPDAFGPDFVTYTITNSLGQTSTAIVYITIRPVNDSPWIWAEAKGETAAGQSLVMYIAVKDLETKNTDLQITVQSSNKDLLPDENIVVAPYYRYYRSLTITPLPYETGATIITVSVTDSEGVTVSTNILLVVNVQMLPLYLPVITQ